MPLYFLYVLLAPFEYIHDKFPIGPAGLNYLNVTMVLALLGWSWARLRSGPPFVTPSPLNVALLAYLTLTYLGLVHTCIVVPGASCPVPPDAPSLQWYLRVFNGILFFWLATTFVNSRRRVRQLILVLSVAVLFAFRAFYVELSAVRRWHYSNDMRVNGPFVYLGANEIAAYFAFVGVFLALVAPVMERPWQRAAVWVASAMCGYAVLYSYSRGAWLAVAVALVIVTAFRYRWLSVVILIAALASPLWLPASVQDRFNMTTDESGELESSAASRKEFAQFALAGIPESPFYGHGVGSFRLLSPHEMDTHNLYLRTLFEGGLIGFIVLMAVWSGILYTGLALWSQAEDSLGAHVGVGLVAATAGLMVANFFGDRFTHQALIAQVWTIAGVGARLRAHETEREPLVELAPELRLRNRRQRGVRGGAPAPRSSR